MQTTLFILTLFINVYAENTANTNDTKDGIKLLGEENYSGKDENQLQNTSKNTSVVVYHYFPIWGRMAQARLMAMHCNMPYEDDLIDMEKWPSVKPTIPTNKLPAISFNNRSNYLTQSKAIFIYSCMRCQMLPTDGVIFIRTMEYLWIHDDLLQALFQCVALINPSLEKRKEAKKNMSATLEPYLTHVNNVKAPNTKYYFGDHPTAIDFHMYIDSITISEFISRGIYSDEELNRVCPYLVRVKHIMARHPTIVSYNKKYQNLPILPEMILESLREL